MPTSAELLEFSNRVGWFHSIDLGDGRYTKGLKTPEIMQRELEQWRFPQDLNGKTALDIGCADGGWSIEMLKRGATVLSIDEQMTGGMQFILENRVFPIEFRKIDLLSNDFLRLPPFDLVLFAGVLYHTQDMMESLKRVRQKTQEMVILESAIDETLGEGVPYAVFYENESAPGMGITDWWGPSAPCLEGMLRVAGFKPERISLWKVPSGRGRAVYHCKPDPDALYSHIISRGSENMAMAYLHRLQEAHRRIHELEMRVRELENQAPSLR